MEIYHQIERTASETRLMVPIPATPVQPDEPLPEPEYDEYEDEDEDEDEEELEDQEEGEGVEAAAPRRERSYDEHHEEGEGRRGRRRRRRGRRWSCVDQAHPQPPEARHEDEEGGPPPPPSGPPRRSPDARRQPPADGFAWTRPWVPFGDDPFVWYDPSAEVKQAVRQPANDRGPGRPEAAPPGARGRPGDDIWVELPADGGQEAPPQPFARREAGEA